jgi:hypothetical protein
MEQIDVDPPLLEWASQQWHVIQDSVLATCAHLLDAVRSGRSADTAAADNLRTFALCEAAYLSASTHSVIIPETFAWPRAGG